MMNETIAGAVSSGVGGGNNHGSAGMMMAGAASGGMMGNDVLLGAATTTRENPLGVDPRVLLDRLKDSVSMETWVQYCQLLQSFCDGQVCVYCIILMNGLSHSLTTRNVLDTHTLPYCY